MRWVNVIISRVESWEFVWIRIKPRCVSLDFIVIYRRQNKPQNQNEKSRLLCILSWWVPNKNPEKAVWQARWKQLYEYAWPACHSKSIGMMSQQIWEPQTEGNYPFIVIYRITLPLWSTYSHTLCLLASLSNLEMVWLSVEQCSKLLLTLVWSFWLISRPFELLLW